MVDGLETALEAIEEERDPIMKEEFMMLIFQGIIYEPPPFEKYLTYMFQYKYMPVVGECQSKFFPFTVLCNELFSPEDKTSKETSSVIGGIAVRSAKEMLS